MKKCADLFLKENPLNYVLYLIGGAVYAFGFHFFITANGISPGGIAGISAILQYLFHISAGAVYFILNLPLIILGIWKMGPKFMLKTAFTVINISMFMQLFDQILPTYKGERFMAALFGGITCGFGIALVMLRGATTGGIDIIAKLLRRRFPYFSMGRIILALDIIITAAAALCYRDMQTLLYTAVALFVSSKMIDTVLYGGDHGKLLLIITEQHGDLVPLLTEKIHRGVTVLSANGGYSGNRKKLLICAVRRTEIFSAIEKIKAIDENAFTVILSAGEVLGRGFDPYQNEEK